MITYLRRKSEVKSFRRPKAVLGKFGTKSQICALRADTYHLGPNSR